MAAKKRATRKAVKRAAKKAVTKKAATKAARKAATKKAASGRGAARKIAVKKAAAKQAVAPRAAKARPTRRVKTGARGIVFESAAPAALTAAVAVPCVPASQAFGLVMGCAGQTFDVDTKLKDVFGDERRLQFCQCVATQSGVPVTQVACQPSSSFGDVMDSISC